MKEFDLATNGLYLTAMKRVGADGELEDPLSDVVNCVGGMVAVVRGLGTKPSHRVEVVNQ